MIRVLTAYTIVLLAGSSPPPSTAATCEWVQKGVSFQVTKPTLVYTWRDCGHPMTREAMRETVACEETQFALHKQKRRLSAKLSTKGLEVVECPAGVRIGLTKADGTTESIVVGGGTTFLGTVLVSSEKAPLTTAGADADEALLNRVAEYLR